jgi:subtilisin family serine protease
LLSASSLCAFAQNGRTGSDGRKLGKHDRELYVQATERGDQTVMLLVASQPGANRTVASGLAGLGAVIRYRDDDLSYVRAIVPIGNVIAAANLAGVQAVNLDELIDGKDPRAEADDASQGAGVPPGPTTSPENAQMPTRDTGAPQFVAANPTYDGRGVRVAIVDSGVDVFTPELQTAKLLDGTPARKIVDWVNYNDPLSGLDPSWVNMAAEVTVSGGSFTAGADTYTGVAADGTYRFGIFDEARISRTSDYAVGVPCGADLNRNGICGEKFAVLWRTSDNRVWVDTNADRSFAGEAGLTDYKVNYEVGTFGTDNPATAVRETVPFVIQTDGKDKYVNIGVVGSEHGTHVAGIAAGKGFFAAPANGNQGAFNGAAPEAQIISVRACLFGTSCTLHGVTEGMIYAAKQANADVINLSVVGLPALNDGNSALAILYNRLIDQSKVQMFISGGNSSAGLNTVSDPAVATRAVAVGAYVHNETLLDNHNLAIARTDGLFPFSSRGPSEAGGFKPQIVAPGSAISCIPGWAPNFPIVGPLPAGYDLMNGTSMSAPQAAGAAALLVSAARQNDVQWKPDQLRQAILSSARYLPGYKANDQGTGLVQVGAAWDLLRQNVKTVQISSSAPVNTVLSGLLATPNVGSGIYEREGWKVGDAGTRTITFKRTSGGSQPIVYNLTWQGNDGTFTSASSVALPLNVPVQLEVGITAAAPGIHSANLRLDDPTTAGFDYEVMNTIVAAGQFAEANGYAVSFPGASDRADTSSYFFNVPAGTTAFKVDLTGITGRVRFLRYHPFGVPVDSTGLAFQDGGTQTRTLSAPAAGVWEVMVEASPSSAAGTVEHATFTVTGSLLGVSVDPGSWAIDPAALSATYTRDFTFTNLLGPLTGNASGTTLGSAFTATPTIAAGGADQTYDITVSPGSTSLSASIGGASDPSADLDLTLFNCTSGTCLQAARSAGAAAVESVSVVNPAAGLWRAVVTPFSVPAGTTAYTYLDVFANPSFGSVSVADAPALHPHGDVWTRTASVRPLAPPGGDRFLRGLVRVTSGGAVLGSAEVRLLNVVP